MNENIDEMTFRGSLFSDKEKFIRNILFSSTQIIPDNEFISIGLKNKNIMFFLNCITESISSISMLGCRNLGFSLIGKLNSIIEYYEDIVGLYDKPKIPKSKINYVLNAIKNSNIICEKDKIRYLKFLIADNDKELIENIKLIRLSLIQNKYFEKVSDSLYELLSVNDTKYDEISEYCNEYFALLIDYIGISIYEIKRIIRDSYRSFFEYKNQNIFLQMFVKFTESYNKNNNYILFVKMDREFDDKLLISLKQSQNDNYIVYSKSGFEKRLLDENITNKKNLDKILESFVQKCSDNNYFISITIEAKDIWHAIKEFRQKTIQPFIGSMLYSGINVSPLSDYIVIEQREQKKFINTYRYYDDIFKPLTQDRIDYSDVFKRYIIENSSNDINKIIDEAVQLLPYYKKSDSILIKFTNTWFALETLFRNSSDTIINGLSDYASHLVTDRMISGYIYVTAVQIKKTYKGFKKYSNNFIENIFINYDKYNYKEDCGFLNWKYKRIQNIIDNYDKYFDMMLVDSKEILDSAYRLRNKQFHGTKDSKLENMSGILYDIVNDTISFYIDYLDVYKDCEPNSQSLYNLIKNIKNIKGSLINDESDYNKKISILYDSVRRI